MGENSLKDTTWRIVFHGITSTFYSTILFTIVTNKYVILIERMITSWYLALHMLFVFFRLFQDVINFTRVRDWRLNILLTKVINLLFISIIFPYAMYIPTVYWLLFYYNSNLIHPNFLDVSLASWISTSSHSVIAIVAFVEMLTTKYSYKGNYIGAIILLVAFTAAYTACLIGTYLQYGFWLYPVFHLFSSQTLFYVFTLLGVLLLFMFLLGKILADFVNGEKIPFFNKLISRIKSILPLKFFGEKEPNVENSKKAIDENGEVCDEETIQPTFEDAEHEKISVAAKAIVDGSAEERMIRQKAKSGVEEVTANQETCQTYTKEGMIEQNAELFVNNEAANNLKPELISTTLIFKEVTIARECDRYVKEDVVERKYEPCEKEVINNREFEQTKRTLIAQKGCNTEGESDQSIKKGTVEKNFEPTVKENNIYCEPERVLRRQEIVEERLELDVKENTAVKECDLCAREAINERKSEPWLKEEIINKDVKEVTFNFDKEPGQSRKPSNFKMAIEQKSNHSNQYEFGKKVIEENCEKPEEESADCDKVCQAEEIECESPSENIDIDIDSSMSSADISVMNWCKNSHSSDGKNPYYGVYGSEGEMAIKRHRKIFTKTSSEGNDQTNEKYPQKPLRLRLKFPSDSSCNEEIRKKSRKGMKTKNTYLDERSNSSDNVEFYLKIKKKDKSFLEKIITRNKKCQKSKECSKLKTICLEICEGSKKIHPGNSASAYSQNKENAGMIKLIETVNEHAVQYENVGKERGCESLKINNHNIEKTKPGFVENQKPNTSVINTERSTQQNDLNVSTVPKKICKFEKIKKSNLKGNKLEEKSKMQYFLFNAFLRKPKSREKSRIESTPERDRQGEKKLKHSKKDSPKKENESERKKNSEIKTNEINTTEIKSHHYCVAHKCVDKMEPYQEPFQQGRSSNEHHKKRRSKNKRSSQISSPNEIIVMTDSDSTNGALQKNRPKRKKKRRSQQEFSIMSSEKLHPIDGNPKVTEINGKLVNEWENLGKKLSEHNRSEEGGDQKRKNDVSIGRTLKRRIIERIFNSSKGKEKNTGIGTPLDLKNSSLESQFEAVFSIFPRNNKKLAIDRDAEKVLENFKMPNSSNGRRKPCNFYATVSCRPLPPSKQEIQSSKYCSCTPESDTLHRNSPVQSFRSGIERKNSTRCHSRYH